MERDPQKISLSLWDELSSSLVLRLYRSAPSLPPLFPGDASSRKSLVPTLRAQGDDVPRLEGARHWTEGWAKGGVIDQIGDILW